MKHLKQLRTTLIAALALSVLSSSVVMADTQPEKVKKIYCSDKKITVGEEFELKAGTNPSDADDDSLRWEIIGKKGIIRFEDDGDDRDDDEVEFKALKAGTTKVRCYIKGKNKAKYGKTYTVKVNKASNKMSRAGSSTRQVESGDDFELKVKVSGGISERHLKWTIADRSVVDFGDDDWDDRYGKEGEFEAKKPGTTKITCKNEKTGKKVSFTVKVVPDPDDDDRDDDWDDDRDDDDDDDRDDD